MLRHMSVLFAHGSLNMDNKLNRTQFLRLSALHGEEVAHDMACASVGRTVADLWTSTKSADVLKNKGNYHGHHHRRTN